MALSLGPSALEASSAAVNQRAARLYSVLELGIEASPDDIRMAYRRLAKVWHPDKYRGPDGEALLRATYRFQEIAAAYEVLNNPQRRKAYDLGLLDLLDVEEYLSRFQDLTLTASGLGMASRSAATSSCANHAPGPRGDGSCRAPAPSVLVIPPAAAAAAAAAEAAAGTARPDFEVWQDAPSHHRQSASQRSLLYIRYSPDAWQCVPQATS